MNAAGSIVSDGNYNVEFKLYDAASSGTLLWTEDFTYSSGSGACTGPLGGNDCRIRVANGYLTANLGSITAFPGTINWNQQLFLTMNIGGTVGSGTITYDGEMSPRLQLTAVPYALGAKTLSTVAGSFTGTLQFASSLGQATAITLPDPGAATATVCYQGSSACGFATGTSGSYIQNGLSQQTANYNIIGNNTANPTALIQGIASGTKPVLQLMGGATPGSGEDILNIQDSTGTNTFFKVDNTGLATLNKGLTVVGATVNINASSNNDTNINTGSSTGKVTIGNGSAGLLSLQSSTTLAIATTNFNLSTAGVVTLAGAQAPDITTAANGSGSANAIAIQPGSSGGASSNGGALSLTGGIATGTTSVIGGAITIQGGNATGASGTRKGGAVTIDGGTGATNNGDVSIGGSVGGANVNIGGSGSSSPISSGTQTVNIGINNTPGSTTNVVVGSGTGATGGTTTVRAKTNIQLTSGNTTNINSSNSTTASTGAISIQSGDASSGTNLSAGTITIDTGTHTGTGAGIVNVGSANATQIQIGNNTSNPSISLDSGTSNINIGTGGQARTINIGTNGSSAVAQAVNIGTNSNASATNTVVIGNSTATASTVAINGGTGSGALSLQAGTSGTIALGTANANTINVGNTTAATVVSIQGGTTASGTGAVSIQAASAGVITIGTTNSNPITLGGVVTLSNLGIASNSSYLCRNATNQITGCNTTGTGAAFVQNGNAFAATAVLGTTDANNLQIITGSSGPNVRATFDQSNNLYLGNGITAGTPNNFTVAGTGAANAGATAGATLTIQGGAGASATTGSAAGGLTLSGGSAGGTGNNNGGVVTLQGGNKTGTGTAGGVLVKNLADSTAAFTVQSAGSVALFNVDSSGATLGVGVTGTTATASTVNVATSTGATQTVAIGGASAGSAANGTTVLVQGGNTATAVQVQALAGGTISVGTNASNTITIGSTGSTGTITVGQSTGTNLVSIGSGNPAASSTQTISIGNGSLSTASSSIAVNILSGAAGNNGTATLSLANNDRVTQVDVGNVVADAARTLNVFTGDATAVDTINIGTGNTSVTNGKTIHIGDGTPTGTNTVTIGSIAATANTTTIQGGTGASAVSVQAATSGTISVGTANANLVNVGNTTAATVVTIQGGTTASGNGAVSIQAGTAGVISIGNANNNPITLGGSSGTTTLQGTVKLSTFSNSSAAVAVCRDSSTTAFVACATGTGNGAPFVQGGNSFGTTAVLGTSDANNLQIITGASGPNVRATFDQSNNLYLGNGVTAAAPTNFTVSGTGSSNATVAGGNLTFQGGTGNTTGGGGTVKVQGGAGGNGAAALGGDVTIQGGTANGTGASNGGNVNIQGGTLAASGTKGLIQLNGSTYFTSGTYSSGTTATITQSLVDSNSSIMATATAASLTFTVPSPTITNTAGRILYITNNGATNAFTLSFGTVSFTLNPGSTASLIWQWNGTSGSWTSAGVDASTLQNVYNNSAASPTPEILLDSSHHGIDIQDANTTLGANESLLAVRASATATSLGAGLFVVNASGKVGINTGSTSTTPTISYDLSLGQIAGATTARTIGVEAQGTTNIGGNGLSLTAGTGNGTAAGGQLTLQGGGTGTGAAAVGGAVLIQGGTSSGASGASNGGQVTLQGGTAGTGGVKGLIQLNGATYFTTGSYSSGSSSTITQSLIDSNSAILATATTTGLTFTVPSPTTSVSGRLLYVTNSGTNTFVLSFSSNTITLNPGATATLIWNAASSVWTGAGADSSSLQNGYNNSTGGTTPEILLDGTSHFGLDIQDSNSGLGATVPLLAVRGSATASTLGTALFVVENNAGKPLVGIGTATASRALDIAVNNTAVNALPLLIEQAGTGDSGIEFKSASKNFFQGIDNTDGQFKISSGFAANGTLTQGDTTQEATNDANANGTQAYKVTASVTGTVSSMSVYLVDVGTSPNIQFGIYADSGLGTTPGTLLGTSSITGGVVGWNTLTVSGVSITSGSVYWLAFSENGFSHFARATSGGVTAYDIGAGVGYPIPTTWSSTNANSTDKPSFYITVVSTVTTDDFNGTPLFRMTESGQTIFQNAANSNTAFQLQNVAGTTLFGLDTSNTALNLGVTGTTATASTVNVGTSTGATQTVNIGSATTGTAANGTTVLVQGGNTPTAVSVQSLASGTIGIGTNNAANTIQIGATGATLNSGTQTINIGNNGGTSTTNVVVGSTSSATGGSTTVQAKAAVTITAGAASTWSTTAGNLSLQAGSGSGVLGLTGGAATGATTAGAVTLQGGAASATAGSNGGGVTITGAVGSSTGTGGTGGTLQLTAGSAAGSGNNNGGGITLQLGAATGTGTQGTFQVQNALGASLLTVDPSNTAASLNLISNGGAETGSPPTGFAAQGSGSSVATGTGSDAASGVQSAKVTFGTTALAGTKISFATAPTASTTVNYIVSFSAKQVSGTAVAPGNTALQVLYSPDNGTTLTATCSNYSSSASLSTTAWTKVSCTFIPGSTTVTTALLIIRQADTPGVSRVIDIDNVSVVQQNSSGTSNVGDLKVGGAVSQGLTLFTLDTYAATPFTGSNSSLAGSMYFDTSQGKIQCYDGSNWGACGAAPNSIITLSPEFAGAVLHGTTGTAGGTDNNIGTLTSDFCSDFLDINDATHGTSICGTNETFNFYRWTSPQSNAQTYDIYITYQLPSTFKNFVSGQTNMLGRTDSANATVTYSVYKNVTGTGLSLCSAAKTISTGVQTTWQTATPTTDLSTCSFAANNSVVVKVEVTSSANANAYIGTLNFQYSNQ